MYDIYHRAIVDAQYELLRARINGNHWNDISVERQGSRIYAHIRATLPEHFEYRCRIDMSRYPVDPYWVGFINPALPPDKWESATDSDPRFWPFSPIPGLHGSFNLIFQGPFRVFWCRECNFPFFYYHGERRWSPSAWTLERVVAHLRDAISEAEPPTRWRPIHQQALLVAAQKAQINLPPSAGIGAK